MMNWLALRMLMGNRAKYVAMLFGLTFASLLICQQCSIFCGVMRMYGPNPRRARRLDLGTGTQHALH